MRRRARTSSPPPTRGLLGAIAGGALVAALAAQQQPAAPQRPATRPDDAAPLYALALQEQRRLLTVEVRRSIGRNLQAPSPIHEGSLDALRGGLWTRVRDDLSSARQLFLLAATRATCTAHGTEDGGIRHLGDELAFLTDLVAGQAMLDAESHPDRALQAAEALLGRARHVSTAPDGEASRRTARALELRRTAVEVAWRVVERADLSDHEARAQRCLRLVHRARRDAGAGNRSRLLREELDELLDRHRSRLRDVHQKQPEGYDEIRFRTLVDRQFGPSLIAAEQHDVPERRWTELWRERELAIRGPAPPTASTPERAARGIAQLAVAGLDRRIEHHTELQARIAAVARRLRAVLPR